MKEAVKKDSFKDIFTTSWRTFVFAWQKEKWLVAVVMILSIVLAAIVYLQLSSFSNIVNEIIRIKSNNLGITKILINQTLILGLWFLLPSVLQNVDSKFYDELATKFQTHINLLQIDSFSKIDIGTFESTEFQTKYDRAQKWGVSSIVNTFLYLRAIISGLAGFTTSAILLFTINPYLVILAILGALPYYFIERKYGKEIYLLYYTSTDENRIESDRRNYFRDVRKMVEVKLFNLSSFFRKQVKELGEIYDRKVINVKTKQSFATFAADIIQTVCLFFAVGLVTYETLKGRLLVGSLLLAFTVYRAFVSTSQTFFQNFSQLEEQARFAKRWYDLFDVKPRIVDIKKPIYISVERSPSIEFKDVSFKYPETDKFVLKNINLKINSGEKLAIVGENGAGKTTFVKLLCRIYDPTEGEILINGINLKNISLISWQNILGVLLQDFNSYQMTVRESIAISKPNESIDDKKVKKSAELSGAVDFIEDFPKKYDQLIWKGFQDGVELSKGQHQRMAVARIFYRDALISILDEPTSAIDAVAEEKIFEVLEKKMEGKTVILISHRFSTVKNADQIAVIEHGELKELGSHKELMAKKGRYEELYTMQASRYLESE